MVYDYGGYTLDITGYVDHVLLLYNSSSIYIAVQLSLLTLSMMRGDVFIWYIMLYTVI